MGDYLRVSKSIFIHLLAPATPVGIDVYQDHFWILFIGSDSLLKLQPLDLVLGLEVHAEQNKKQYE